MSAEADARPSEVGARWVGQTLDERYRILAVLGEGGMGAVFRAEHLRLAKAVAVKIILPEHAGNAELARRFAREAMVSAKLEHPHVVSALDSGELPGGGAYLVMSLAPGTSLRTLAARRTGWRFACEVGEQIADALCAAHAIGVVHRDLKPDNVMVEEREDGAVHARVLDFGIARAIDASAAQGAPAGAAPLTRVGTVLGTPGYMPPEQALGDLVDTRADLYALGVVIWEVATGRRLFAQTDLREIAMAQLTEPVPELGGDAPAELQTLLDALLMPKAADRPASAIEVQSTLKRLARSAESATPPPSSVAPAAAAPGTPIPATISSGYAPAAGSIARPGGTTGPGARRPSVVAGVLALLGVVGVVAVATIGVRTCTGDGSTTPAAPGAPLLTAPIPSSATGASATDEPDLSDVPEDLRADARTLITSGDMMARSSAAARLQPERARLPAFLGHLADFELADDCEGRRTAVRALRTDGDVRAIAPLERIQALPATGCGADGTSDCHHCMRHDVDRALSTLRGAGGGAPHSSAGATSASPPPTAPPEGAGTKQPPHGHGHGHHR